ncbi:hypothetical protein DSUL_60273 [Desulfovibrionales bacterium]
MFFVYMNQLFSTAAFFQEFLNFWPRMARTTASGYLFKIYSVAFAYCINGSIFCIRLIVFHVPDYGMSFLKPEGTLVL